MDDGRISDEHNSGRSESSSGEARQKKSVRNRFLKFAFSRVRNRFLKFAFSRGASALWHVFATFSVRFRTTSPRNTAAEEQCVRNKNSPLSNASCTRYPMPSLLVHSLSRQSHQLINHVQACHRRPPCHFGRRLCPRPVRRTHLHFPQPQRLDRGRGEIQ